MEAREAWDRLLAMALAEEAVRRRMLATRREPDPLAAFCREATALGCPLTPMALVEAGEAAYAAMSRSTNGGGENHPMLIGEDDLYGLFFAALGEKSPRDEKEKGSL